MTLFKEEAQLDNANWRKSYQEWCKLDLFTPEFAWGGGMGGGGGGGGQTVD